MWENLANKNQYAHHNKHEVKDLQQTHECARMQIKNKISTYETNLEPPNNYRWKQGSSKELGYQLKGDLSHMYRFLIRQTIKDIHPQRNLHIWNGRWRRDHGIQKGSHEYTK